jgi:DNA-binding transcriptional ArsR family regulator
MAFSIEGTRLPAGEEMRVHARSAAALLKTLANPARLQILCVLGEGELCVGAINASVPLSQSALSQHLAVLREDGLVQRRRESQSIYYALRPGPALDVIRILHAHFCPGLRSDEPVPRATAERGTSAGVATNKNRLSASTGRSA